MMNEKILVFAALGCIAVAIGFTYNTSTTPEVTDIDHQIKYLNSMKCLCDSELSMCKDPNSILNLEDEVKCDINPLCDLPDFEKVINFNSNIVCPNDGNKVFTLNMLGIDGKDDQTPVGCFQDGSRLLKARKTHIVEDEENVPFASTMFSELDIDERLLRRGRSRGCSARRRRSRRSDARLKRNVIRVGTSASGIPEYTWNYIADRNNATFHGTIAQDLLLLSRDDAVSVGSDGMYSVDYSILDVAFYEVV